MKFSCLTKARRARGHTWRRCRVQSVPPGELSGGSERTAWRLHGGRHVPARGPAPRAPGDSWGRYRRDAGERSPPGAGPPVLHDRGHKCQEQECVTGTQHTPQEGTSDKESLSIVFYILWEKVFTLDSGFLRFKICFLLCVSHTVMVPHFKHACGQAGLGEPLYQRAPGCRAPRPRRLAQPCPRLQ